MESTRGGETLIARPGQGNIATVAETDTELVRRAQQGDQRAFQTLVERYQSRAFAVALGVVRREDEARDVVQDSFLKVYRHLAAFQGNSSFYTWMYRIVTNMAIDHIRRRRRAREASFDDMVGRGEAKVTEAGGLAPSRSGSNPHKEFVRRELMQQLNAALDTLSPTHRAVILLREQEGLSYEEMAEVMQCSKGTIMSRLHHARKNVQRALKPYLQGRLELD